jgi:hypothetical protein
MKAALFMSLFPGFMQPYEFEPAFLCQLIHRFSLIGTCLTHVKDSQRKARQFLVPIIEERYRLPREERPNDFLTWLMEDAVGGEKDPGNLTVRMLLVNFAAIHNTSGVGHFFFTYTWPALNSL